MSKWDRRDKISAVLQKHFGFPASEVSKWKLWMLGATWIISFQLQDEENPSVFYPASSDYKTNALSMSQTCKTRNLNMRPWFRPSCSRVEGKVIAGLYNIIYVFPETLHVD